MAESILHRLRQANLAEQIGTLKKSTDHAVLEEWQRSGVGFASSSEKFEQVFVNAVRKLLDCIVPTGGEDPVLHEGGIYLGCWLESTGTINAELLSRFIPSVSESTYRLFHRFQREDGLMPYKVTGQGPVFRQIQMVTPLARCVWNHYKLHGSDKSFLRPMYEAMKRQDEWLAAYRDTRGSGCVEAFCTFDTGHDLSPRFWHVPDTPHQGDPKQYNPDSPILPFLAPDLTANVYCQRRYLALMAAELGETDIDWNAKAEASLRSLFEHCFDAEDHFFYDVDRNGELVRVQSDVLLRVLACEAGDREFFDTALRRYLLNTSKFFTKYPLTSIAMDDPRFDPSFSYNSWAGPTNFLSLIRTPHAFEHHGRYVELTWILYPIMSAMANMERFPQTLNPWTGAEGFTETYSPSILCLLDYVERLSGILPTPEGKLWFTGLLPYPLDHGDEVSEEIAYSRTVDGACYELVNTRAGATVYRGGELHISFPYGIRVVTDREGRLTSIIGMRPGTVQGILSYEGRDYEVVVKGNEQMDFVDGAFVSTSDIGVVFPTYR
ncbi:MGH1-like glycoside hydrolase domain-containing protein [Paenibacillus hexagrammi]|uniref:Mannosylglycerate hydrolase MGH1-like glycoside hydrolase domain-containing protein n=1 Tax=Paenibacillus hexagrammi TaxID=2908839 RepID=A0ABY3SHB0_9BACL|nr:hypothetical protein [Paenibacillus sp. YPD9-1]UJF33428.1 hypothetical protein L0M14_28640 [Paenibacillus sp. YPD9-1]